MKKSFGIAIMAILSFSLLMSSCIVSKKKYDQAVYNGRKSLDSLNKVFNNTVEQFNQSTNTLKINNSNKDLSVDELTRENQKLAGDKATLNQSLINSINEFNAEKQKLQQKTRTADSLMNILALQSQVEDSLRTLDDSHQKDVQNMLITITKLLQGINQSDAYAQQMGGNIMVTLSNDYLFKTATSTDISKQGDAVLKKLGAALTLNENCKVQVISNTDATGQAKTLLELSSRRAASVVSNLVNNCSLPVAAYTASGRGMYNPLEANTTDENKKKNRRTEIIIFIH